MPPMSINQEHSIDLRKNKIGPSTAMPGKAESEKLPSEQLTKHEWEQVGNQNIHKLGNINSSTVMMLSLTKYRLK